MSMLPWRILVVTDLGVDSRNPAPVTTETLDEWFASLKLPVSPAGLAPAAALSARLASGTTGAALDAFLHDPKQQRIEAAWRGMQFLLAQAGGPVAVEVLSLPRKALVERFREAVHAPELTAAEPVTLVVLDFDFTHKPEDLGALTALSAMAAELQAPIVANAGAGFFDLRFLVQAGAVKDVAARVATPAHAGWQAFQKSEDARWLCLTLNRFLLREPWKVGAWAEGCAESNPDSYLWGRGVWMVGAAVARSAKTHGHAMDLSGTGGRFDGLPTREFPVNANQNKALATEVAFAEMQSLELTHAAFTPLTGGLGIPTVMMPMVVSVHRYTPGKLTVEGTLAYQLSAARVALACGTVANEVDGNEAAGAIAAQVTAALREQLGGLLGESAEALAVEVLEADETAPRRVAVTVKPPLVLESKTPVFAMEFAIG